MPSPFLPGAPRGPGLPLPVWPQTHDLQATWALEPGALPWSKGLVVVGRCRDTGSRWGTGFLLRRRREETDLGVSGVCTVDLRALRSVSTEACGWSLLDSLGGFP